MAEIERAMRGVPGVDKSIVTVVEDERKEKYLTAYYISKTVLPVLSVREELKTLLPEGMIPQYLIQVADFPLLPSGKVNRKALPDPRLHLQEQHKEYKAPQNLLQETIQKIWIEVLGINSVSIDDNFFELGGQSIKAIQLTSRILAKLNTRIELRHLFTNPTIESLSKEVESIAWINETKSANEEEEFIL